VGPSFSVEGGELVGWLLDGGLCYWWARFFGIGRWGVGFVWGGGGGVAGEVVG